MQPLNKVQKMDDKDVVLDVNYDLPIRSDQPVHNGKVRSVYWLTAKDSERLIKAHGYSKY